jgi:hypothetical protein
MLNSTGTPPVVPAPTRFPSIFTTVPFENVKFEARL